MQSRLFVPCLLLLVLLSTMPVYAQQKNEPKKEFNIQIVTIAADQTSVTVETPAHAQLALVVTDSRLKDTLKAVKVGDRANIETNQTPDKNELVGFTPILAQASTSPDPPAKTAPISVTNVGLTEISGDQTSLKVTDDQGNVTALSVQSAELKALVKSYYKGDRVSVTYQANGALNELQKLAVVVRSTSALWCGLTLIGIALLFVLILWGMLAGAGSTIKQLVIGMDGRYSNSKCQVVAWFGILIISYIAVTIFRAAQGGLVFVSGVGIPQNLLVLSGLSALTFTTAKTIKASKDADQKSAAQQANVQQAATVAAVQQANTQQVAANEAMRQANLAPGAGASGVTAVVQRAVAADAQVVATVAQHAAAQQAVVNNPSPSNAPAGTTNLGDLLKNDTGGIDLGDTQMIVIAAITVVVYFLLIVNFMSAVELHTQVMLPDVDTTILSTFGLGQGAYLIKKYVGDSGRSPSGANVPTPTP